MVLIHPLRDVVNEFGYLLPPRLVIPTLFLTLSLHFLDRHIGIPLVVHKYSYIYLLPWLKQLAIFTSYHNIGFETDRIVPALALYVITMVFWI